MHVIITGGSSGIGLSLAGIYLGRGENLTLIARDKVRLQAACDELAGGDREKANRIFVQSADTRDQTALEGAVRAGESRFGPCDLLIASAGLVEPSDFEVMEAASFQRQIDVNLIGTVNAVRSVYLGMKARGTGKIMIVSSGAAFLGFYGYTAYCASKAALSGFVEALATEVALTRISIALCFPPDTQTPQYEAELPLRSRQAALLMGSVKPWPVEKVAARIVRAIDKGKSRLYFDFSIAALFYLGPFIKPILNRWLVHRLQRLK